MHHLSFIQNNCGFEPSVICSYPRACSVCTLSYSLTATPVAEGSLHHPTISHTAQILEFLEEKSVNFSVTWGKYPRG